MSAKLCPTSKQFDSEWSRLKVSGERRLSSTNKDGATAKMLVAWGHPTLQQHSACILGRILTAEAVEAAARLSRTADRLLGGCGVRGVMPASHPCHALRICWLGASITARR